MSIVDSIYIRKYWINVKWFLYQVAMEVAIGLSEAFKYLMSCKCTTMNVRTGSESSKTVVNCKLLSVMEAKLKEVTKVLVYALKI